MDDNMIEIGNYYFSKKFNVVKKLKGILNKKVIFDDNTSISMDDFDDDWEQLPLNDYTISNGVFTLNKPLFASEIKYTGPKMTDNISDNNESDDRVNHPSYYQDPSGVECIDIVRHRDFNIGSAIKYLWRAGLKKEEGISDTDKQIEDLKKAIFYINDEIELIKKKQDDRKS